MLQILTHSERQNQSPPTKGALAGTVGEGLTVGPPVIPPVATVIVRPEFIRLPKTGTACPHSSLRRSELNSLVLPCAANGYKPPVRSYVLRKHGKVRGIRVIDFESLCSYIRNQANGVVQPQKPENVIQFNKVS